jgi:hypothetical protein
MDTVLTKNSSLQISPRHLAWNMKPGVVKRLQRCLDWHTAWLSRIIWCWTEYKASFRHNTSSFTKQTKLFLPSAGQTRTWPHDTQHLTWSTLLVEGHEEKIYHEMTLSHKGFWAFTMYSSGLIYRVVGYRRFERLYHSLKYLERGTDGFLATCQYDPKYSSPLHTLVLKTGSTCSSETSDSNYMNTWYTTFKVNNSCENVNIYIFGTIHHYNTLNLNGNYIYHAIFIYKLHVFPQLCVSYESYCHHFH